MKILLLNPSISAQHPIAARLQADGSVLLLASNSDEAWKLIQAHGGSLDLAIIHRESAELAADDPGCKLIDRIKADTAQADLPMILSSSAWGEGEFFQHQQTPSGVNAYLHWPFDENQLAQTIEAMFGASPGILTEKAAEVLPPPALQIGQVEQAPQFELAAPPSAPTSAPPPAMMSPTLSSGSGLSIVLEESTNVTGMIRPPAESLDIQFEAPDLGQQVVLDPSPASPPAQGEPILELALPATPAEELDVAPPVGALVSPEPPEVSMRAEAPAEPKAAAETPARSSSPAPTAADTGSLDISAMMSEDLEPHERLELERKLKGAGKSFTPETATMVLEGAALGTAVSGTMNPRGSGTRGSDTSGFPRSGASEDEVPAELSYLFEKKKTSATNLSPEIFSAPVGDAVVPGGASQTPDAETFKKYLMLREQDVAVLSNQLKSAREQIAAMDRQLKEETSRAEQLDRLVDEQRDRIEEFEKEKSLALEGLHAEIDELKFQNKNKSDKARILEVQVEKAAEEIEKLKGRVRADIRKIRVREKELENKLELVKKDSEALISAREARIIELKRKIDLLEFNMDLLQDQHAREKENSAQLRERLGRAAQVVRVAGGLLDTPGRGDPSSGDASHSAHSSEKKNAREAS